MMSRLCQLIFVWTENKAMRAVGVVPTVCTPTFSGTVSALQGTAPCGCGHGHVEAPPSGAAQAKNDVTLSQE